MKNLFFSSLLLFICLFAKGQDIYSKAFGDSNNRPIIFLHGGPGYNAANFEATTAQLLADKGFYVIVYDRRGEGRSIDSKAQYTFRETFDDINTIYKKYGLKKATLIGHSFGGQVAILFAKKYPEKIQSVILVAAPVSFPETFKTIISSSKNIYREKNDSVNLNYIAMLEKMDPNSLQYSSYCFMHAMKNGFYSPKNPSENAQAIYSRFKTDPLLIKYGSQMTYQAPQGFWNNEKYTTINIHPDLIKLADKKIEVFALYGKDDGLYSAGQVADLQRILGDNRLKYFDNCSHNVFIDQQPLFIQFVENWAK